MQAYTTNSHFFGHHIDYCPVKENFVNHIHTTYECYLFIRGNAEFLVENELINLNPNDILIIKPGRYHVLNILGESPYERYVINFSINAIPLPLRLKMPDFENCIKTNLSNTYILQRFSKIREQIQTYENEMAEILLNAFLLELLVSLEKQFALAHPQPEKNIDKSVNPLISRLIEYINNNINSPLSLEILAGAMFASRSLLSHKFSETMNIGLMEYVKMKKIYRAQMLLLNGEKPTSIYQKCGFNDYATFYRTYKRIIGIPPSQQ